MRSLRLVLTGLLAVVLAALLVDSLPVAAQGNAYATVVLAVALVLLVALGVQTTLLRRQDALPHLQSLLATPLPQKIRFAAACAVWAGYILVLPALGFAVSTFLAVLACLIVAQGARLAVVVPAAAAFSLTLAVLVRTVFYIPVPEAAVDEWIDLMLYRLF